MESKVLTETFKNQVESLASLDEDGKYVAILQTLRMSLITLKYSINREDLHYLFELYDKQLNCLLLEEYDNVVVEYIEDAHKGECCIAKEEFSDDEKEDSSWASRLSAVTKERKVDITLSKGKEENIEYLVDMTTGPVGTYLTESDPVTSEQHDLLTELAKYGFLIRNYRKFLDILEMYRDEDENVIRSTNVFSLIMEKNCGHILLNYLKK